MNKARGAIPYGKHSIDKTDIDAVVDVLTNRFLTQGSVVSEFERSLATYCGAKHCVSVNSGTSGLHVACLAAGIDKGDLVWTVPNSFAASANCALYCGATIDFVDIDPETRNLSLQHLEDKLKVAAIDGSLPKALVVVHYAGHSCDMREIKRLTSPYGVILIEDAAHGLGGKYLNSMVGSCEHSDIAVMSFHPVKSITTGEGGAVLTNDPELFRRSMLFSKHGITRDSEDFYGEADGAWYYQQTELGYNYRLSDIHAALGLSQLQRLNDFIECRRCCALRYQQALDALPVLLPREQPYAKSAWHIYTIEVVDRDRREVFNLLKALGIGVNVHYIPIHLHPYYQKMGFSRGDFPNAENFYKNAITIPLFPDLTADDQDTVIEAIKEVLT